MEFSKVVHNPKIVRRNILLDGTAPSISLEKVYMLKNFSEIVLRTEKVADVASDSNLISNLSNVSKDLIDEVHTKYGEEGLFKLQFLAISHNSHDFNHFVDPLKSESFYLRLLGDFEEDKLDLSNHLIPAIENLQDFNTHLFQPSLSRKMYNPGRHHGYFVYGLGRPRILVSHPFRGLNSEIETYDIYNNSIDLLTSLMIRGYYGSFLFLDYLPGLNYEEKGFPAWLHWFSIISIHSDLVIFVKDPNQDFGQSQKMEAQFTPDFTQKKIVEVPFNELTWAKESDTGKFEEIWYVTDKGKVSKEEWYRMEAEHASPFINGFIQGSYPKDRFTQINENGTVNEYPLNYPIYQ